MPKLPHEDRNDALRAWLIARDLVGDFARAGCSAATFRMFWHKTYTPGFDPAVPDWFKDYPDIHGETILLDLGFTPAEIATEKAKPRKNGGGA